LPEFSIAQAWHPRSEADSENRWLRDPLSRLSAGREEEEQTIVPLPPSS